jgi:hypothetical protein
MTKLHETYNAESIATEMKRGNNQEAARSSRDFEKIYKQVNEQIDKMNKAQNLHLPHLELVDGDGKATTDRSQAKGIKVGSTTYGTDTVRNSTTTDAAGGKQVRTADGEVKNYDKNGNQVMRDSTGHEKTIYAEQNKPTDKDIGKVKSQTIDGQGNRVLEGEDGSKKTIDKTGKEITDSADGNGRKIQRPDGSGETIIKNPDGSTHIHTWHPTEDKLNYDVLIKPNGDYNKKIVKEHYVQKGLHNYQWQPDERF